MLIRELAQAVHENAVAHGWWEGKRSVYEIVALIHSEWSEALEEARAGRPLAYIEVFTGSQRDPEYTIIERAPDGRYIARWGQEYTGKPEGIAVELIDGCIRILDYMGYANAMPQAEDGSAFRFEELYTDENISQVPDDLPRVIATLHFYTAQTTETVDMGLLPDMFPLLEAMTGALCYVKKQGIDPLKLLLEKHEYNKGRPYKHGKKF